MPPVTIKVYKERQKSYPVIIKEFGLKESKKERDRSNDIKYQPQERPQFVPTKAPETKKSEDKKKEYPFKFQVQETPKYVPKPIQKKEKVQKREKTREFKFEVSESPQYASNFDYTNIPSKKSSQESNVYRPNFSEYSQIFNFKQFPTTEVINRTHSRTPISTNTSEPKQKSKKIISKQESNNPLTALNLFPILGFAKTVQVQNDVKNKAKNKVKQEVAKSEMLQDILGVLRENGEFRPIEDIVNMGIHGVKRKFGIGVKENKSKRNTNLIKAMNAPTEQPDTTVLNVAQSKASYNINNDTIKFFGGYSLPTSINLNGVKLGARNRGDVAPIKSAEIIPMYKPIISYEQGVKEGKFIEKDRDGLINEFLGFDKDGNIKIGTFDKFGPGDTMTQVYYGWINSIPRDNNGNLMFERYSKSRDHRKSPIVDRRGETKDTTKLGDSYRGSLLLSTGNQRTNFNADLFGDVAGGAYILQADNEFRFVRGSVNNVIDEIEKMQKNHKGKPIKFYEVDNGSYSRGLRSFDNILTPEQQRAYDSQNWYAGHFFYITPESYPIKVVDNKASTLKDLREGLNSGEK